MCGVQTCNFDWQLFNKIYTLQDNGDGCDLEKKESLTTLVTSRYVFGLEDSYNPTVLRFLRNGTVILSEVGILEERQASPACQGLVANQDRQHETAKKVRPRPQVVV